MRRFTENVSLPLSKVQLEKLERLVKVLRYRTKQQVLRRLIDKASDEELGWL